MKCRNIFVPVLCLMLITCQLFGCSFGDEINEPDIQLSEEQEKRIDLIVQNRDEWGEDVYDSYQYWPINQIHIAESGGDITILSVGHIEDGTGMMEGSWIYWGVHGYAITDEDFVGINEKHHTDWMARGVRVDLDDLDDDELRSVIEESYIKYLSEHSNTEE